MGLHTSSFVFPFLLELVQHRKQFMIYNTKPQRNFIIIYLNLL